MSPTSYQTAPPRKWIIATASEAVKLRRASNHVTGRVVLRAIRIETPLEPPPKAVEGSSHLLPGFVHSVLSDPFLPTRPRNTV